MAGTTIRARAYRADLALGVVMAGISAAFLVFMRLNPSGTPIFGVSPLTLPQSMVVLLLALSLVLVVQALMRPPGAPPQQAPREAEEHDESSGAAWRLAALLGVSLAFAAALPWLGFLLCGGVLVAVTAWLFGNRQIVVIAAMALLTPFLLSLFFEKAMVIYLPAGRLFQ